MGEALEGEIVPVQPAQLERRLPKGALPYLVHAVDLPNGGRVEGMDRATALWMARYLGTQAYEADAVLYRNGLVVVQPIRPIRA